ncbi:MAG: alpha/beta hydrolase, partial [Roseiflexaceae bacterium]|nr:alpha/beta hydrolase [Roseiflexaceae bacterium]
TYGSFEEGTARRAVFPAAVEHIGVLFSPTSLDESVRWFDAAFGRETAANPYLDQRVIWIAVLFLGAVGLFWAGARIATGRSTSAGSLDQSAISNLQSPISWWLIALGPAVLAPLLLRVLPVQDVLPILVGGPLALLFLIYGLLTAVGLWLAHKWHPALLPDPALQRRAIGLPLFRYVAVALLTFGYVLLTFGLPAQQFLLNYFPPAPRWWVFVAVLVAMLPYFLADEWLTRRAAGPRWAYPITKVLFVVAMALAITLDTRLFFLVLVAPVFVLYFVLYGLFSRWLFRATGSTLPGALANAAIFAWFVAAVFPLVA